MATALLELQTDDRGSIWMNVDRIIAVEEGERPNQTVVVIDYPKDGAKPVHRVTVKAPLRTVLAGLQQHGVDQIAGLPAEGVPGRDTVWMDRA